MDCAYASDWEDFLRAGGSCVSHGFSWEMRKISDALAPEVLYFFRKVQYCEIPVTQGLAWVPVFTYSMFICTVFAPLVAQLCRLSPTL